MSAAGSLVATCHCGLVTITAPRPPVSITDCNCSICRRYGVLWAYYDPSEIILSEAINVDGYAWATRTICFQRCRTCGCVTHWIPSDPARGKMGINARLFPPETLEAVPVRKLDGAETKRYLDED